MRQAALGLIRREDAFLVAELEDPRAGAILHGRP